MTQQTFDVMSPWAETDPQPLQGISPRLSELHGKRIGLFANYKRASDAPNCTNMAVASRAVW